MASSAPPPGPPLASQLSAWVRNYSLEIAGNYASMSIDPDQVFEIQLATLTA